MAREQMQDFSYAIDVSALDAGGTTYAFAADADGRAALAKRFDLLELDDLAATARVFRSDDGRSVWLEAQFSADVVQACVVTLEPVRSQISESFTLRYVPATELEADAKAEVFVSLGDDEVEPLYGDTIDAGAAVAEHLALALDPYPRKPGVEFAYDRDAPEDGEAFSVLAKLKNKV